jgi:hypothetical protein
MPSLGGYWPRRYLPVKIQEKTVYSSCSPCVILGKFYPLPLYWLLVVPYDLDLPTDPLFYILVADDFIGMGCRLSPSRGVISLVRF